MKYKEFVINYLENGDEGNFVECNGRVVEITNMCGGRYLCLGNGDVSGQTNDVPTCVNFLIHGGYVG